MYITDLQKLILTDMKVELLAEYDLNFVRKAFFSKPWAPRKLDGKGSLLNVRGGGGLRGSISGAVIPGAVTFRSGKAYAQIMNEGGDIVVTAKMKRFFWARYYELSGKVKFKKDGNPSRVSEIVSKNAEFFRNMALMKVGRKIHIPQRRFIGDAPEVDRKVKAICDRNLKNNVPIILRNGVK